MKHLSLVSLAAVAACSGAPVMQSAPTAPGADPKTEAEVATALETAKFIKDKCIGMLPDGGTSFRTDESDGRVTTTLEITKGSQNGDTTTKETCVCIYITDIPTLVREGTSCVYSHDTYVKRLEMGYTEINTISHTEKPGERSFTSSGTCTFESDRKTLIEQSGFMTETSAKPSLLTETSADGSGCRMFRINRQDWSDETPYDPAKLDSCEYFADQVSIFAEQVRHAICKQLESSQYYFGTTNRLPPLCSGEKVYDSGPGR